MLTLKQIKENKEKLIQGLKKRNWADDELHIIDDILEVDKTRRASQTELDQNLSQVNSISKEIGLLFKQGKREEAEKLRREVISFREKIKELEEQSRESISALDQLLLNVPNTPHELVPGGNTDEDNQIVKNWDMDFPDLGDSPLAHWDLAEKYKLIDFKLGVKLTGSGFPVFRGKGAKLERALIWFFLDQATKAGYEEFIPPLMVNADSARATGQLPDKDGQMYHITEDNFYMIPTAEVPVTNIYRNSILKETDFPIKLTAYSPCFRREAGSYGSDVKGLNRVHQFDKVEIVQMAHPDKSYEILDEMLDHVEGLLKKLELPYRILRLCGGDLGFTSALTYDFEVYSAAQKRWLEVSSVSNFETYQSNRLKLRFKGQDGKMKLAHTLNGSALALARIVAAILENNQTAEGIKIPEVLIPLTGFSIIN